MSALRSISILLAILFPVVVPTGCEREVARETEAIFESTPPPEPIAWPDGQYRIAEVSRGGLALLDVDDDGDLDLLVAVHPPPGAHDRPAPNRLYLNDGQGSFWFAPEALGLDEPGRGTGFALGDVNGDGRSDVLVTNIGSDVLLLRDESGQYVPHPPDPALSIGGWSSSAVLHDLDGDGDLDAYISRYVEEDPDRICRPARDAPREYCGPHRYRSLPDRLLLNRGDGTFEDVSQSAGIVLPRASFQAAVADFNEDGRPDIYVACDMQPNLLWIQQPDGTYVDRALEFGLAVSGSGKPEAGMGLALADIDSDGALDVLVTHLRDQTDTLYLGTPGASLYRDRSASSGLGAVSLPRTGWGCEFGDFDLDGHLDLAVTCGGIQRGEVHPSSSSWPDFWRPYCEPGLLYLGRGEARFESAGTRGGSFTREATPGRSLAAADLDGDGDLDLVETDVASGFRVHLNRSPPGSWVKIRLRGRAGDGRGARLEARAGARGFHRHLGSSRSFGVTGPVEAHLGLGGADRLDAVTVHWPGGSTEQFGPLPAGQSHLLVEGEGDETSRKEADSRGR